MVTLFLLAVRYIHPRSPLPRQIWGRSEKYPALVSGLRPAQLRCVYGCRILCPGCFLYQFRNALVQGSFPLILSFQGISSFLHIFITQRQQDILPVHIPIRCFSSSPHRLLFISYSFTCQPTPIIQSVVLWKMLYSFTIGFSRFFKTIQIV